MFVLLFFILAIVIAFMLPPVQRFAIHKGTDYFNSTTGGELTIRDIDLRLPWFINLNGVTLNDPEGALVAKIGSLKASIGWRMIFNQTIRFDRIELDSLKANIHSDSSGHWNYAFITEAFSDSLASPDTSSAPSPWDVSIGNVALTEIDLQYYDAPTRDSIATQFGALRVVMDRFSLAEMVFLAESIDFTDSESYVQLHASADSSDATTETLPADTSSALPNLHLGALHMAQHALTYKVLDGSMSIDLNLGLFDIEADKVDLNAQLFELDRITLRDTRYEMRTLAGAPDTTAFDYNIFIPIDLSVAKISLSNDDFRMVSTDPAGIQTVTEVSGIEAEMEDLEVHPDLYEVEITRLVANYAGAPALTDLSLALKVTPSSLSLKGLNLDIGQSHLQASLSAQYESLQSLMQSGHFPQAELHIDHLRLHPDDLASIANIASTPDSSLLLPSKMITLEADILSNGDQLKLKTFILSLGSSTMHLGGQSIGYTLASLQVNLDKIDFNILPADFASLLPADLDLGIFPEEISFAGKASASAQKSALKGEFNTDIGRLKIDATSGGWDAKSFPVKAEISSKSLDLGKLAGLDSLLVSFNLKADVANSDTDQRNGHISITVPKVDYGAYALNDITAEVDIDGKSYEYVVEMSDSVAQVSLTGEVQLGDTIRVYANGDITGVDFEYLGLTEKDFRLQTYFTANYLAYDSVQSGDARFEETIVIREGERIDIAPVTAKFLLDPDSTMAMFNSEIFDFSSASNLSLVNLRSHISGLFKDEADPEIEQDGFWKLRFESQQSDVLQSFIPGLNKFSASSASIDYDAGARFISAKANFPEIAYDAMYLDSLGLDIEGAAGEINGDLRIRRVAYDTLGIEGIKLQLRPAPDGSLLSFAIFNGQDSAQYFIETSIVQSLDDTRAGWILEPSETFVLAGQPWKVDPAARITLKDSLYGIENFALTRKENLLSIHTPMDDTQLHIKAENFALKYISRFFTTQQDLANGRLSAEMNINVDGTFEGSGEIKDLKLAGAEFGQLDFNAISENGKYQLTAGINGPVADLKASGTLTSQENGEAAVNVDLDLTRFDFESLQRLIPSVIAQATGAASAKMKVSGTTSAPEVTGTMRFKDIDLRMTDNQAEYKIANENINFEPGAIVFPSFVVSDAAGQRLIVEGEIKHKNFSEMVYDLRIRSNNFTLLDLLPGKDPLVYGKLIVDSDIKVSGSQNQPVVRSDVSLKEGTAVVYQVPEEEYDDASFDGLVEWVSFQEQASGEEIITREKPDDITPVQSTSVDLNGILTIDPETSLKIVIDPLAGDNLTIKGGGKLGLGYDRSGRISVNGTYRITSGEYLMTFYNIVKRRFALKEGSSLTFNGDPASPDMDITAIYKTRIALGSLMGAQGAEGPANESLRRQADFELHMRLSGDLTNIEIGFEIKLGDGSKGILGGAADARIAQINQNESELNRQVFAMLVLNTFLSDGGASSSGVAENTARNSASQILTQQLNALSDKLIDGVELTFDVESYTGATGQGNTDLSVDLAKSFLNNRVVVKVGSTVAVEGDNASASQGQQVVTNVVIEYKITEDGRYRFKVFRTSDLEDIVVGRITRTGVGVLFRREFDRGEEIFAKPQGNEQDAIIEDEDEDIEEESDEVQPTEESGTTPESDDDNKSDEDSQ